MVNQIYPPELHFNKANTSNTETPFLDLHLSISNGFVSSKIYDKRDDFDFDIVNFPFLDEAITPSPTAYRVPPNFARRTAYRLKFYSRTKYYLSGF